MSVLAAVREIIARHGLLSVDAHSLAVGSNLYDAGLTSLATVAVMLAVEERFSIELPDAMLSRKTFESLASLAEAVEELVGCPSAPAS
jgi:acyl carrier protein